MKLISHKELVGGIIRDIFSIDDKLLFSDISIYEINSKDYLQSYYLKMIENLRFLDEKSFQEYKFIESTEDDNFSAGIIALTNAGGKIKFAYEQVWLQNSSVEPNSELGKFLKSINWEYVKLNRNGSLFGDWFFEYK
jgi:hypothetical protein